MNKDLYDKKVELPEEVTSYLKQCFEAANGANESTEGYNRNKELRETGYATYQQLKRMKNWFDSFNGHDNDLPFILNGGHYVKNWVNDRLGSMRDESHLSKKIKSEVLPNQFISPHEKNNLSNMNRPSKEHGSSVDDLKITEDILRINNLIKKII